ncbi:MAG: ComF family protein [Rhodospirillales bacterium]|jgi:ComF family protein|nr:ComF family protein [Rhodospirillales bacterium]
MPQETGRAIQALHRLVTPVLDTLLPHSCLACGTLVDAAGVLCPTCWEGIELIGPPCCDACGLPFEYEVGHGAVCGACAKYRPPFGRARAPMLYSAASRKLVLSFKHGDRTYAAPAYAGWMVRAGADLIAGADLLVPVPLHWTRLFARRYNQAALLAHEIGKLSGLSVDATTLVRRRRTPSQGAMGRSARRRNVAGAFSISKRHTAKINGRKVLLIDDVMTTGATVSMCTKALLRAGAVSVDVLTLARVPAPAI